MGESVAGRWASGTSGPEAIFLIINDGSSASHERAGARLAQRPTPAEPLNARYAAHRLSSGTDPDGVRKANINTHRPGRPARLSGLRCGAPSAATCSACAAHVSAERHPRLPPAGPTAAHPPRLANPPCAPYAATTAATREAPAAPPQGDPKCMIRLLTPRKSHSASPAGMPALPKPGMPPRTWPKPAR